MTSTLFWWWSAYMLLSGVVIALITFLVGFGVCLHAGAVFGRMWSEWQAERVQPDEGRR